MNDGIDALLDEAFSPQRIIDTFYDYKLAKWDHFSGCDEPIVNVPVGTDGVTHDSFEKQLYRHVRNIRRRILTDTYIFHPFREVDKKKNPHAALSEENTRTLGIASVRDALVQIILYNHVLYESVETLFTSLDPVGPVSFAYRKRKSAPLAASFVHRYAKRGYRYVYDADLSKFFDTIPHDKLLNKLARVIGGSETRTYRLVRRFIRTDRTPHESYHNRTRQGKTIGYRLFHWRKPARLRPKRDSGVPQGGVLSGMLANLYLHEFDEWVLLELGREFDLKYVRYADDFVLMLKSPALFEELNDRVCAVLESGDFGLKINKGKTRNIDIVTDRLNFVGFNFDGEHVRVRQKSLDRFKNDLKERMTKARLKSIQEEDTPDRALDRLIRAANLKIRGFRDDEQCPRCRCQRVGRPRSWLAFFKDVTDPEQIRALDKWIRQQIYSNMYSQHGIRIGRRDLDGRRRHERLRSLVNEIRRVRKARLHPCLCDIRGSNNDIWGFAPNMFRGRRFKTLARRRPFTVPYVDEQGLQVSVGKRQYRLPRTDFEVLWARLMDGERVSRTELETTGMRNTSHIVALMAEFPGVVVRRRPISLSFEEKPPADFVVPSHPGA